MSPAAAVALPEQRARNFAGSVLAAPLSAEVTAAAEVPGGDSRIPEMVSHDPISNSTSPATVLGVVFCGGRSSRMGEDKALLVGGDGRTMLERACRTLAPLAGEIWLACGPSARYEKFGLPLVLDQREDGGPLAGLEAVLDRATARWIVALACDMPRVTSADLAGLMSRAAQEDLDACWLETSRGAEPLCAVYSRTCLEPVRRALDAGLRRMIAFHSYPVAGRPLRLAGLDAREGDLAQNLNTPADWDDFCKDPR